MLTEATTVLTLAVDDAAQQRFDRLRRQHYPPTLNRIPAHITLFHTLPATLEVATILKAAAASSTTFALRVESLRSLGRGVALRLESSAMHRLHAQLASQLAVHLTPQDRQPFRPHVVVQNKVQPADARATLEALQAELHDDVLRSWETKAVGLDWWDYLGGPWRLRLRFNFTAPE